MRQQDGLQVQKKSRQTRRKELFNLWDLLSGDQVVIRCCGELEKEMWSVEIENETSYEQRNQ